MPIASSVWIVRWRRSDGDVGGGEVEVRRLVERPRRRAGVGVGEVEELHLGRGVEAEAPLAGPVEVAAQHLAGVALERRAVDVGDVAEHPGRGAVGVGPREQLEAVRVGPGEHVALLHPAEAVDGRAVEAHALVEGALELGRGDGEGLELAEHVGEPEPDEPDPSLLDRAQDVVVLAFHGGANDGRGPRRSDHWACRRVHIAFTLGKRPGNRTLRAWPAHPIPTDPPPWRKEPPDGNQG